MVQIINKDQDFTACDPCFGVLMPHTHAHTNSGHILVMHTSYTATRMALAVNYTLPDTTCGANYSMHGYYSVHQAGCDLRTSMEQVNVNMDHWSISIHQPTGVGWGSPRLLQLFPCRSVACLLPFHTQSHVNFSKGAVAIALYDVGILLIEKQQLVRLAHYGRMSYASQIISSIFLCRQQRKIGKRVL